jgi:two-component system sensor histidine kinase KdpD
MSDARPDPDELLKRVQAEERKDKRGHLTVFFGAAPGVGKTFAMLLDAGYQRDGEGRDVVAGIVETHGRFETATLLADFEQLPRRKIAYRGTVLDEFDLDAALARRPSLLLVDELAHTNAEGSRHPKRWQDVDDLLDAGIDVMTTLNVQHIESLNDVVAQITGVTVRETVPDSVLELADDVRLVDLPPDELLERLREGKVYLPAQAERAIENFFRKGNLIALRELALRKTAERVDADMQAWRKEHGIEKTWAASDRLLVCISPSPFSANLLRVGRRMAAGLRAEWYAVNVETAATLRLPASQRARLSENMRLAEQLGAATVTLTGGAAAEAILRFAREHNITKIIAGKPRVRRLRDRFVRGFVDELIAGSRDIDIYVTVGDDVKIEAAARDDRTPKRKIDASGYLAGALTTTLATIVARVLFGQDDLADAVMTYLVGIVLISMRFDFRVAVATAILSVLAFDFFFVPPFLTFTVADLRHIITFVVMLLVAVVIAGLTQRVKDQVEVARRSEERTAVLYAMSRALSRAQTDQDILQAANRHIEEVFEAATVVLTRDHDNELRRAYASQGFEPPLNKEMGIVSWVWSHRREAGLGTSTVPGGQGFYLPLVAGATKRDIVGVLGIYPKDRSRFLDPEQRRLAEALATQFAMAVERLELADETQHARLEIEAEQLRSTLLSSVSHDLRTPLAVMKGAASTLVDDEDSLAPATRRDLAQTLLEESERLERLVRNLLDMTRLESGAVRVNKEWQSVEETVGGALSRVEARLVGREVTTSIPPRLLAPFDGVLIEQVLINLLENAAKHTAPGTAIEIRAVSEGDEVVVEVADRGHGLPAGEEERVFEKFHRGRPDVATGGVGLGLAICHAVVRAHGGRMWAGQRPGGGASFKFALPLVGEAPSGELPEIDDHEQRIEERP